MILTTLLLSEGLQHSGRFDAEVDIIAPSFPVGTCIFYYELQMNRGTALLGNTRAQLCHLQGHPSLGWLPSPMHPKFLAALTRPQF